MNGGCLLMALRMVDPAVKTPGETCQALTRDTTDLGAERLQSVPLKRQIPCVFRRFYSGRYHNMTFSTVDT